MSGGKDAKARIWDESDEELGSFVDSVWDEVEVDDNNVYAFRVRMIQFVATYRIVRSVKGNIVTNRVKASNLAHILLRLYKTNWEGVPRNPSIRGAVQRKSIVNNLVTGQPGSLTNH